MSDRIDELADAVNKMTFTMADTWFDGSDVDASARFAAKDAVMETVNELATIAREAEAMVDWLVQYAVDCGECPRTRYDEDEDGCRECLDSIRRSAHKAVSK